MSDFHSRPLVVVDVGNTRTKLGIVHLPLAEPLPHIELTLALEHHWQPATIDAFLPDVPEAYTWAVASVNRPGSKHFTDWLAHRRAKHMLEIEHTDMPLVVDLAQPEAVGVDRLADAVAANRLRQPRQPAVVIGMGSALTVNLINSAGAFAGGAILPGVAMSARALHEFTDLLPLIEIGDVPDALGTSTPDAIRSGLYWGAVGAVRELVEQLTAGAPEGEQAAQIFLTGGAGPLFADVLKHESRQPPLFVPHLTLAGIAIAAVQAAARLS